MIGSLASIVFAVVVVGAAPSVVNESDAPRPAPNEAGDGTPPDAPSEARADVPPEPAPTTEPRPIEPRTDDGAPPATTPVTPLPPPDEIPHDGDDGGAHHGPIDVDKPNEERDGNPGVPIVQAGAGAVLLASAPFVATIAVGNDAGGAILLALSAYPGMIAVLTAVTLVVVGADLIAQGEAAKDECFPCGAICGEILQVYGYVALIAGVIGAVAAPFAFWAMIGVDRVVTGHDVRDPLVPLLAASGGALGGAAVLIGGAIVNDALEVDSNVGLALLSSGVGLVGATTGYVLTR